jgi:hypothetical protein
MAPDEGAIWEEKSETGGHRRFSVQPSDVGILTVLTHF